MIEGKGDDFFSLFFFFFFHTLRLPDTDVLRVLDGMHI